MRKVVAVMVMALFIIGATLLGVKTFTSSASGAKTYDAWLPTDCIMEIGDNVSLSGTALYIPVPEYRQRFAVGGTALLVSSSPPTLYCVYKDEVRELVYVAKQTFTDNGWCRNVSQVEWISGGVQITYSMDWGRGSAMGIVAPILICFLGLCFFGIISLSNKKRQY